MKCKDCHNLIKEYIAGELDSYELENLKSHLQDCKECREMYNDLVILNSAFDNLPELEVPEQEMPDFENAGNTESSNNRRLRIRYITIPISIAASVLIFFGGYYLGNREPSVIDNNEELAALKKEITETKNLMILTLLNQHSASKRIQAVNYAAELDQLEPEVMQGLFNSLSNDNSINVRLATLETLARYAGDPMVRVELVKALENQDDPVIQLNMINLMVMINEKSSAGALLKLVEDENTPSSVKEQAEKGLEVLL